MYEGSRANWKESDACHPVNAYGRTKLEAEQLIQVGLNIPGLRSGYRGYIFVALIVSIFIFRACCVQLVMA